MIFIEVMAYQEQKSFFSAGVKELEMIFIVVMANKEQKSSFNADVKELWSDHEELTSFRENYRCQDI